MPIAFQIIVAPRRCHAFYFFRCQTEQIRNLRDPKPAQ